MILRGSDQYFMTPAVRTIGEEEAVTPGERLKAERRLRAAFQEMMDAFLADERRPAASGRDRLEREASPPRSAAGAGEPSPPGPPPQDPAAFRRWEIAAAIEVALDETGRLGLVAPDPEEIASALAAAFPEEPAGARGEAQVGRGAAPPSAVFEIPYDHEIQCLMRSQLLDPRWAPAGLLRFPEQPNEKN
jgi:hypothetical protein